MCVLLEDSSLGQRYMANVDVLALLYENLSWIEYSLHYNLHSNNNKTLDLAL